MQGLESIDGVSVTLLENRLMISVDPLKFKNSMSTPFSLSVAAGANKMVLQSLLVLNVVKQNAAQIQQTPVAEDLNLTKSEESPTSPS